MVCIAASLCSFEKMWAMNVLSMVKPTVLGLVLLRQKQDFRPSELVQATKFRIFCVKGLFELQ